MYFIRKMTEPVSEPIECDQIDTQVLALKNICVFFGPNDSNSDEFKFFGNVSRQQENAFGFFHAPESCGKELGFDEKIVTFRSRDKSGVAWKGE